MSLPEPTAYFRTLGGVHVTIRPADTDGQHIAECEGCGWVRTSREATRGNGGQSGIAPRSPLAALKFDANKHAAGCAEVPRSQWPGDQPMSGGW